MKSILVVVALCMVAGSVFAQGQSTVPKIGFVNSTKIFQELPEAQDVQKKIDAFGKPLQDSLETMQLQLQSRYEEYQKKEALMTEAAKRTAQQELIEMEREFNQFRLEKFGSDGELAKHSDKLITPIKNKIIKAIETVAKQENYTFVFDRTEQVMVLLYGDVRHDLTNRVIDNLKRGK